MANASLSSMRQAVLNRDSFSAGRIAVAAILDHANTVDDDSGIHVEGGRLCIPEGTSVEVMRSFFFKAIMAGLSREKVSDDFAPADTCERERRMQNAVRKPPHAVQACPLG